MSTSTILMIVGVVIIFVCLVMMILNMRQKTNFQKGFNKHLLLMIPFAFGGLCLFVGAILALSNLVEKLS